MKRVAFLDTSGWVAAALRQQRFHAEAKEAYTSALRMRHRMVTTTLVLAEAHVLFMRLVSRETAIQAIESVMTDPLHEIVAVEQELIQTAVDSWIRPYRDQRFSLCDAVSFAVMKQEGNERAIAIDVHFQIAGFTTVN